MIANHANSFNELKVDLGKDLCESICFLKILKNSPKYYVSGYKGRGTLHWIV